jgi:hypothetical protein
MVPSSLPPPLYKRRQEPHNPLSHPFPTFLWVSLVQELTLAEAQATATTTPHRLTTLIALLPPSYDRWGPRRAPLPPQASTVTSHASQPPRPRTPSSSCHHRSTVNRMLVTVCSPSSRSMPFHRESNVSHSLESLHQVHAISRTKINPNSRKNHITLHQHPYLFYNFCSNPWF